MKKIEIHNDTSYPKLIEPIVFVLDSGRKRALREVDNILVRTYWGIGRHIVDFEQNGNERVALGKNKRKVLELVKNGQILQQPQDSLKYLYVFEFLSIQNQHYCQEPKSPNQKYLSLIAVICLGMIRC